MVMTSGTDGARKVTTILGTEEDEFKIKDGV